MKKAFLYLTLLLLFSTTASSAQSWIDQLKTFRDAVYQRDKEKVKQFFTLPVADPGNEFWLAAQEETNKDIQKHLQKLYEKHYPLTEELFMLYFDQIFHKKFIACFLKLKTKDLYEKGETVSPEFSDDNGHLYNMSASYDPKTEELTMIVNYHYAEKVGNGEYDPVEYSHIYQFRVIKGQLKFVAVAMAG